MSEARKLCRRACKYRFGETGGGNCDYIGVTGRSRVKAVYELRGVERMTEEQLEKEPLLRPENCPVFEKRPKGWKKPKPKEIALPGSRAAREGRKDPEGSADPPTQERRKRKAYNKGVHSFDTIRALRLWQQGMNDIQIAEELGTRRSNIYWWRKVNGLPTNWKGRKKDEAEERGRSV